MFLDWDGINTEGQQDKNCRISCPGSAFDQDHSKTRISSDSDGNEHSLSDNAEADRKSSSQNHHLPT